MGPEQSSRIKVIYEDACVPADALRSAQKLIEADEVDMINGVFCIVAVQPIVTLTKPLGISVLMTATVPDTLIDLEAHVFSPNSAIRDEARSQADYAYNVLGARTASVMWMNSDFGSSYSTHFSQRFTELGGSVLTNEPVEFFGSDYRTELVKVGSQKPDLLLSVHFGNQMALIIKQARELGINATIMGTYEAEDMKIVATSGTASEGLIVSSPIDPQSPAVISFNQRFKAVYGEDPTVLASMAYDGFKMQVDAYTQCEANRACITSTLSSIKDYTGVTGTFDMTSDGTARRSFIFKKVQNSTYVPLS